MGQTKHQLFVDLFQNFLKISEDIEAAIVSDNDGFIIAGEKRKDIDMEIVSILGVIVNPIMERLRNEFAFKEFGTANFDTSGHRLLFVSIEENKTLSVVLRSLASVERISPYAYYIAEKVAQILNVSEDETINIHLPEFDFEPISTQDEDTMNIIHKQKIEEGGAYRFKFIIIGDHMVGKTSIVRRFVGKEFLTDYRATMGLHVMGHSFEAYGNNINLSLWDIGAQEYFKRYRKIYYKGAQAAFIVFDITSRESFENVKVWHDELREFTEYKDLPIIIVGNKNDLINERQVKFDEGIQLARDLSDFAELYEKSGLTDFSDLSSLSISSDTRIMYIETSALNGDNVENAFNLLSYHYIIKSMELEEQRLKSSIIGEIKNILESNKNTVTLSFVSENPLQNPLINLILEIEELGQLSTEKDKKKEQQFNYSSGLVVKNHDYDSFKSSDSDGVFLTFELADRTFIDPQWNEILIKILDKIGKNKVIIIGLLSSEKTDASKIIEDFVIPKKYEKKNTSIFFIKINAENKLELYEQLEVMVNEVKNLMFSY
ncbi:MAG: GTP-binding protein [Candidatus Lokiarchaeota archaeon]|nr:GTP-binding protein [Candidatus Lokiarchaeota archaeon]